jgi:AraC family transcriptional regulator
MQLPWGFIGTALNRNCYHVDHLLLVMISVTELSLQRLHSKELSGTEREVVAWLPSSQVRSTNMAALESTRKRETNLFTYPQQRSQFTPLLRIQETISPGIALSRIETSAGYNSNAVPRHIVGLHLGAPVPILHQRNGQEKLYHFGPEDVVFTPAGPPVHYAHPEGVDALYIALEPAYLRDTIMVLSLDPSNVVLRDVLGTSDPVIHRIGQYFLRELCSPGWGSKLYMEALGIQLAVHLIRHYTVGPQQATPVPASQVDHSARLQPAIDYIHHHLGEDLSLADIAATTHLSPYHFSRLFREAYRIAPYQYVIQQRVEVARQLLKDQRLTVSEVALLVGFSDHSHLVRHYKRLTGTTPRGS